MNRTSTLGMTYKGIDLIVTIRYTDGCPFEWEEAEVRVDGSTVDIWMLVALDARFHHALVQRVAEAKNRGEL